jgi:hypothetical protein
MSDRERTHDPTRSRVLAVGILALSLVSVVFLTRGAWYTPSTTAYVRNDTPSLVTLGGCADNAVTVMPGAQEEIRPFADAAHAACRVFNGDSDQGSLIGCLNLSSSHGHTSRGAVARVSATRPSSPGDRCP